MTISQNTETTNRIATATLPELLAKINSLPEAGSGGGVETCTVRLKNGDNSIDYKGYGNYYVSYVNGQYVVNKGTSNSLMHQFDVTFENILCGSLFMIGASGWSANDWEIDSEDGGLIIALAPQMTLMQAPTTPNTTATFTLYGNDD